VRTVYVIGPDKEVPKQKYPDGWKSSKPYIRVVPQPHG
jgi:hypothetical protein